MNEMIISTKIGSVKVDPNTIITFPKGILGFPKLKDYVLLDPNEKSPLKLLQSVDEPTLAFVVTNPLAFKPDYEIRVFRKDLEDIEVEHPENVMNLVIVSVPRDPSKMTANLKGPIIVNAENRKAKQLVLDDNNLDVKYRLLAEKKEVANG